MLDDIARCSAAVKAETFREHSVPASRATDMTGLRGKGYEVGVRVRGKGKR